MVTDNFLLNLIIIDDWYRFGQVHHRTKAQHVGLACESAAVQYHTIIESDPARVCPKRQMWHLTCHIENCLDCRVRTIDASHLNKMTFAGSLASWIISNLKVKLRDDKTGASMPDRHTLMNDYSGCISPKNIDFDSIQKDNQRK